MGYSTFESVNSVIDLTILKQLLNDENRQDEEIDLTDPNDLIVIRFNQLVVEVAEEIDNSLRGSYKLPLTKTSNTIQSLSDDRVVYNAKKRRLRDSISDSEQKIYNDGTNQLKAIRQGDLVLDLEPISSETVGYAGEIRVNKTPADRTFNKDMWNKY
jgi:phage gp36-like protein